MKFKYMIFGSLLTIIIIISAYIISISFKNLEIITVKEIEDYSKINESLKEKIAKVKNKDCQKSLDEMLKRIDGTYFEDNVTIEKYFKAYFEDDKTIINYFDDVLSSCKLTREETDYIYVDVLASMNYPNKMKERYELRYEFELPDFNSRKKYITHDEVGTYTTKTLELKVLKNLIEEVNSWKRCIYY